MEIERTTSVSIAKISPVNVLQLIEFMIDHHTESESVRIYLQTLVDTGVIRNLIESIIEFNKDQTEAFNKLLTTEQIEVELASLQEDARNKKETNTDPNDTTIIHHLTQTPQVSLATRIRNLFTICCCWQRRRPRQEEKRDQPMTMSQSNNTENVTTELDVKTTIEVKSTDN
jgi:uncharacterized protein (DUF305 family)